MIGPCRVELKRLSVLKIAHLVIEYRLLPLRLLKSIVAKICGSLCLLTIVLHGKQVDGAEGLWLPLSGFGAMSGCSADASRGLSYSMRVSIMHPVRR